MGDKICHLLTLNVKNTSTRPGANTVKICHKFYIRLIFNDLETKSKNWHELCIIQDSHGHHLALKFLTMSWRQNK